MLALEPESTKLESLSYYHRNRYLSPKPLVSMKVAPKLTWINYGIRVERLLLSGAEGVEQGDGEVLLPALA